MSLAILHQLCNLKVLQLSNPQYHNKKHVVYFDTVFHSSQDKKAQSFGLTKKFYDEGIYTYGFH